MFETATLVIGGIEKEPVLGLWEPNLKVKTHKFMAGSMRTNKDIFLDVESKLFKSRKEEAND